MKTPQKVTHYTSETSKNRIWRARKSPHSSSKHNWWRHELKKKEKPRKEKVKAILQLNPPTSSRDLKSFFGAIQNFANFLPKLSEEKPAE